MSIRSANSNDSEDERRILGVRVLQHATGSYKVTLPPEGIEELECSAGDDLVVAVEGDRLVVELA